MNERNKTIFKYGIGFIAAAAVIFAVVLNFSRVIGGLKFMLSLLTPLIVGGCTAFFLNVPMKGYEKLIGKWQTARQKKKRRVLKPRTVEMLSLTLALASLMLVVFIICRVVLPRIVESIISIYNTILESYPKALTFLDEYGIDTTFIREWVNNIDIDKIMLTLKDNVKHIVDTVTVAASSVVSVLVNGLTGVVLAVYILANKKQLGRQVKRLLYAFVSKTAADRVCEIASLSSNIFSSFISGQCVECLILCAMFLVVLAIGGFPYAAVISIIIAALAVIPYIGAFAGCAIGVLLILMVEPRKAIWVVIVFFVIQQIENQLIYPRVVGKSVGLPPMWTLLAALLGGKLFGIVGLLFFIPFTSVLYALLQTAMRKRLRNKRLVISEQDGAVVEKDNIPKERE